MNEDKPYDLQPPLIVADMLAIRAWEDDVDDDTRLLCEMGADTIRGMNVRMMRLARLLEKTEADAARMAAYIKSLAGQKGGAA